MLDEDGDESWFESGSVMNLQRRGEQLTDAGFARRIRRYYYWVRSGLSLRDAHRRAMLEVDRFGLMEGESDDYDRRQRRVEAANKQAEQRRRQYRPVAPIRGGRARKTEPTLQLNF